MFVTVDSFTTEGTFKVNIRTGEVAANASV
jgi:hypothetical protein